MSKKRVWDINGPASNEPSPVNPDHDGAGEAKYGLKGYDVAFATSSPGEKQLTRGCGCTLGWVDPKTREHVGFRFCAIHRLMEEMVPVLMEQYAITTVHHFKKRILEDPPHREKVLEMIRNAPLSLDHFDLERALEDIVNDRFNWKAVWERHTDMLLGMTKRALTASDIIDQLLRGGE